MTDIALIRKENGLLDIEMGDYDLTSDAGLRTAVLLSLFVERTALGGDELPDGSTDKRGFWADPEMGSRRWLLSREKLTQDTDNSLREYDREALQWLIDDGIATSIEVTTTLAPPARIDELIIITRADGSRYEETFNITLEGA